MKKELLTLFCGLVMFPVAIFGQNTISTNVSTGGMHLLTADRANVQNITISSDKAVTVNLYDSDNMAAPYYGTNSVTGAYPTRLTYTTNYVTTFVGQNGFTNWYTNAGLWTITITNAAATNALSHLDFVIAANTAVSYDVGALFVNGITMRTTTNASVVLNYNSGR